MKRRHWLAVSGGVGALLALAAGLSRPVDQWRTAPLPAPVLPSPNAVDTLEAAEEAIGEREALRAYDYKDLDQRRHLVAANQKALRLAQMALAQPSRWPRSSHATLMPKRQSDELRKLVGLAGDVAADWGDWSGAMVHCLPFGERPLLGQRASTTMTALALALFAYRNRHGAFPDSLAELVPARRQRP